MADMLSQDEINALLGNVGGASQSSNSNSSNLSENERETLSAIGVETMAASAGTLAKNLRQTVVIDKPKVEKILLSKSMDKFSTSSLGVRIEYKVGVEGSNVLVLGYKDAKIISNLMQGGDGTVDENDLTLSMIDESALCEAMNQMVGSSSTVLFKILGEKVDIDTPKLFDLNLESEDAFLNDFGFASDRECMISTFPMKVGDLIDSFIVQIMPEEIATKLMESYLNKKPETKAQVQSQIDNYKEPSVQQPVQQPMQQQVPQEQYAPNPNMNMNMNMNNQMQQNMMGMGGMQMPYDYNQNFAQQNVNHNNMNARPAQFQNFDFNEVIQQKENINIIMDVPLEVTVEMGRTVKKIEEILEFSPGTIIELDKLAGDPIDILVNGKFVAKGEVVVIDENYGIRITDIINFKNRI